MVLNLQKAIGIAGVGDLAGKTFCLMLERVHTEQHNIYINGVLIYNYVDPSPIVSNFSVGRLTLSIPGGTKCPLVVFGPFGQQSFGVGPPSFQTFTFYSFCIF